MSFDTIRLSKHFILLDFMYDRDMYVLGQPVPLHKVWDAEHHHMAQKLCVELLEPCIAAYGPCSIAGGFWPAEVKTEGGHHVTSPHHWDYRHGAAADVVWHDWVNSTRSPILQVRDIDERRIPFDRLITYAGSEFMCMAIGHKFNRGNIYENVRVPGKKHNYLSHGRTTARLQDREDWRRDPHEKIHGRIRPHHVRVGRFFTLLDFCHNGLAIEQGLATVPPVTAKSAVAVSRCLAEALDPVVATFGRISVTRGYESSGQHNWNKYAAGDVASVRFVLPEGTDHNGVKELLAQNANVDRVLSAPHASRSTEMHLSVRLKEPNYRWTSATGDEGF